MFDFSNYPKNSKFFDPTNKNIVGKMRDKSEGKIIGEFVWLKSKMYSIKYIDGKDAAKGANIATEFNEFKDILVNKKVVRHKMKRIQSKKHKLGTDEINKPSLSCFDDIRFVLNDVIHTFATLLRGLKSFVLRFGAFLRSKPFRKKNRLEIVPKNAFYYTTSFPMIHLFFQ